MQINEFVQILAVLGLSGAVPRRNAHESIALEVLTRQWQGIGLRQKDLQSAMKRLQEMGFLRLRSLSTGDVLEIGNLDGQDGTRFADYFRQITQNVTAVQTLERVMGRKLHAFWNERRQSDSEQRAA